MKKTGLLVSALLFALALQGQSAIEILLRARVLNQDGKPGEAIELLSGAVQKYNDYRLFLQLADSKVVTEDYEGAIRDYSRAGELKPFSGNYGLSRVYAIKKDVKASLDNLGKSMNSRFKRSEKEIMLDNAFSRVENTPEWRLFWKKEWYSDIEKGISEIEFYLSAGKQEEATAILADLKSRFPENNDVILAGALIKSSSGKYQDALKDLDRIITLDPGNDRYLKLLASCQIATSNFAGASSTYSKLIAMEIPDAGLYLQRAESYRKTGELGKCMNDIEKFLLISPMDKKGLGMAGRVTAASGDNLKALRFFSENLRLHPNDPECYNDRANAYFLSKSWNWAINDYTMSLDLNPDNPEVWLNKGIALINTGKPEDACHDFRKSLDLGNKKAAEYISRYCIK